MQLEHNFIFVAAARAQLKAVGYDDTLCLTGLPQGLHLFLECGDLLDFPELDRFMFVVTSRRFSFRADGLTVTYLLDLVSDRCKDTTLNIVK